MRLVEIEIHNYKSLRSVSVQPGPLSVLVGPNAGGKSNFCDALDFIGEMYRWGLELAVARHGGYENICYRHTRRSKSPIRFCVRAIFDDRELGRWPRREPKKTSGDLYFEHRIEFGTDSRKIEAPIRLVSESIAISALEKSGSPGRKLLEFNRRGDEISQIFLDDPVDSLGVLPFTPKELQSRMQAERLPQTVSLVHFLDRWMFPPFLTRPLSLIRVFQFSPGGCRQPGVPTPNPELERSGVNLPAVIDFIRDDRPQQYRALLATLKRVMPTLEGLEVSLTPQKTFGLSFREGGFGRPWTSEDVSDGTIRAVALLAAVFDPGIGMTVIEEPENSLHPWAIRQFVEACRTASKTKQIILTTHSPILVNELVPEEVWVVQRPGAETKIEPLSRLDPEAQLGWKNGQYTLAEYLDAGGLPAAVPALPG
jgi:predicted ATPase